MSGYYVSILTVQISTFMPVTTTELVPLLIGSNFKVFVNCEQD